jgi:hypothetical protein
MDNRLTVACMVDNIAPIGFLSEIKKRMHRDVGMKIADVIGDASVSGETIIMKPHGLDIRNTDEEPWSEAHHRYPGCTILRLDIDVSTTKGGGY